MEVATGRDDAAPRSSPGAGAGASWAETRAEKRATRARKTTGEILEMAIEMRKEEKSRGERRIVRGNNYDFYYVRGEVIYSEGQDGAWNPLGLSVQWGDEKSRENCGHVEGTWNIKIVDK